MKKTFIWMAAILLLIGLSGCDLGLNGTGMSGGNSNRAIDKTNDWMNGGGSKTFTSLATDTFKVDWSCPSSVTDFCMVVGKGWQTGSSSRTVHYVGNFNPNITTYSNTEWQNAYLSLYGWAHKGTEIIEYYVLDGYGEFYQGKPGVDSSYTTIGNSYTSNGSTYHMVTKTKNDYHAFGSGKANFRQLISIRDTRKRPGNVDGIITFSDHVAAWGSGQNGANYGGLTFDGYQILAVEANNSNGTATIKVEECEVPKGTATTTNRQFKSEFTLGGEKYLAHTIANNNWQSDNWRFTDRIGWDSGATDASMWQAEQIGSTSNYYIKNVQDGKYLTFTLTTTDPNKLVDSISPFYINLYANPLFTDEQNAGEYGFRQHWQLATDSGGMTILKSRVNTDIAISLNYTSGYAQGVPTSMLASRAVTINTRVFYEKWNMLVYGDPGSVLPTTVKNISNKWSGKRLTVISSNNDAETRAQPDNSSWTSQNWTCEKVGSTTSYRIKNKFSGRYLNARDSNESAVVACYDLNSDWGSMQWTAEAAGDGGYRFKNVWSGKYLTIADTSDYSKVLAQSLHTDWASQVWYLVD
jgi:hypothetical protein